MIPSLVRCCGHGLVLGIALLVAAGCSRSPSPPPADPLAMGWPAIEQAARGQTLRFVMWTGDPAINRYIGDFIKPRLKARYDLDLAVVPGQADIPNQVLAEIEAGSKISSMDLVWINGETFHKLRQMKALFGPFTAKLPNDPYVDWANPIIARDFQQPVEGFEAPWGTTQLLLIADSARVPDPPRTPDALARWIHAHPGRFTFDSEPVKKSSAGDRQAVVNMRSLSHEQRAFAVS